MADEIKEIQPNTVQQSAEITPADKPVDVEPEIKIKEVTADELFAPLAKNMPIPTGPLPEIKDDFPPDPNAPKIENKEAIKDRVQNVFDSTKYKVDEKGAPRLDKRGVFIPLNKGRTPGVAKEKGDQTFSPTNNTGIPDEFDAAAAMYFDMATGILCGVISDEWTPENDAERLGMIKSVAAYLRFKGTVDLTPGQALLFVGIAYAGKRMNKPKTRERVTLWYLKLKSIFKKPQPQLQTQDIATKI